MVKDNIIQALLKEGYSQDSGFDETVDRLFSLEGEPHDMLAAWIRFDIEPKFNCEGIDSTLLRSKKKKKNAAIILAFDMLKRFPESSLMFNKLMKQRTIYKPQI